MSTLLRLVSVHLKFGGISALSDVTWDLPGRGGIYGIIGPNGAGKSTWFNLVTGIYKPTFGKVFFDGVEIQGLTTPEIVRMGMARTFQNIRLLPHLSVLDNLRVVGAAEREGTFWKSLLGFASTRRAEAEITDRAKSLLRLVGLSKLQDDIPTSLPYGDQRKLEIARALMRKPKLLLLDEPAAGMNPTEKKALAAVLREIASSRVTILVIEHDMKFIMNLCQHITVLRQGSICAQGTPLEIQNNPKVIETYLGKRALRKTNF